MDRRQLLNGILLGTGGVLSPLPSLWPRRHTSQDAFLRLSQSPLSPRHLDTAFAQNDDETAVVVVKVLNHIHTPLCFYLGDVSGPAPTRPLDQRFQNSDTYAALMGRGVHQAATNSRWASLHFNNWFANILATGKDETDSTYPELRGWIGAFPPADDVAVQGFLHLNQTSPAENHSFRNTAMRVGGGDLNYFADANDLISSPFGICCLTMGNTVETTDGSGRIANRVLGPELNNVVADGRQLGDYVQLLERSLGGGFEIAALQRSFDELAGVAPNIRTQMSQSRAAFARQMESLQRLPSVAGQVHNMTSFPHAANFQATGPGVVDTARCEFLANCLFVRQILEMPGRPIRNFSLLLNIFDLDGRPLDVTTAEETSRPLTYVEGMRQLAMGLNVLAQTIRTHRNVYVIVTSEGGRNATGADDKVSHGLLLGPGAALRDHTYVNQSVLATTDDPCRIDPNQGAAVNPTNPFGLRPYDQGELKNESGQTVSDQFPDVAAMFTGLARHLASRRSLNPAFVGLGNYIKLKTKS